MSISSDKGRASASGGGPGEVAESAGNKVVSEHDRTREVTHRRQ